MRVSVIVPIYNGEKYLRQCLDSLANQTLDSYEVICINDGSTDGTREILEEYMTRYPSVFRVFHISNSGAWNARERGIQEAHGEYIGFCDCDDYVEISMYETLYNRAVESESDMVVCAFQRVDGVTNKVVSTEMTQYKDKVFDTNQSKDVLPVVNTALWNKLIRRDIVAKHVVLDKKPRVAEDMMFLLSLYPRIHRLAFCEEPLYTYFVREGSAMSRVSLEEINVLKECMESVKTFVMEDADLDWENVISMMALIHFGVSVVMKANDGTYGSMRTLQNDMKEWLSREFPSWKKNPYLRMTYILKGHTYLLKPWVILTMYRMSLLPLFLQVYRVVTEVLKIDIKW